MGVRGIADFGRPPPTSRRRIDTDRLGAIFFAAMVKPPNPERARQFRMKADELRTACALVRNPDVRSSFLRMADNYDRLADQLEGLINGHPMRKPEAG